MDRENVANQAPASNEYNPWQRIMDLENSGLYISGDELQDAYDKAYMEVVEEKLLEVFNTPLSRRALETAWFAQFDTIAPSSASASADAPPAAASATPAAETPPQDRDTDDGTRSPRVFFVLVLGCHPWLILVGGRPHRLRPHAPGWQQ